MVDESTESTESEEIEDIESSEQEEKIIDNTGDNKIVAPVQYDITSYGADYDVEGLVNRLDRKDILIPPFQRNYVWTIKEASKFIESLLLGLPVPGVFLAREKKSNKMLVIDGQQRLKTLLFFYKGIFNPKEEDKQQQIFKLIGVQEKFEGCTYTSLEQDDQIRLNDSVIHATIIKQDSPKDDDTSIYHIFDRLNSKGRRLTPQEIRTAISHGPFINLIKELNIYPNWREIYGKTSNRLKDQELILRFLALFYNSSEYKKPMNEFLNIFCDIHRDADERFLNEVRNLFTHTIDIAGNALGRNAFRPAGSLNAAVFDSVMVGIARRLQGAEIKNSTALKKTYDDLLKDVQYVKAILQSTADENNVAIRIDKTTKAFSKIK